jgi:hypothetical protein
VNIVGKIFETILFKTKFWEIFWKTFWNNIFGNENNTLLLETKFGKMFWEKQPKMEKFQ